MPTVLPSAIFESVLVSSPSWSSVSHFFGSSSNGAERSMDCCTSMACMALGALGAAGADCMIVRRACRPHAPCIAVQGEERADSRGHQVTARRLRDEWRGPRAMMSSARSNAAERLNGVVGCSWHAADYCSRENQWLALWQARGLASCGCPRLLPGQEGGQLGGATNGRQRGLWSTSGWPCRLGTALGLGCYGDVTWMPWAAMGEARARGCVRQENIPFKGSEIHFSGTGQKTYPLKFSGLWHRSRGENGQRCDF